MKFNPAHAIFDGNMFVQLQTLLDPIIPPAGLPVLDMSIGEPQQPATKLLTDSVSRYNAEWQFYPKATGSPRFIEAVETYGDWPWQVKPTRMVLKAKPTWGTITLGLFCFLPRVWARARHCFLTTLAQ